MRWYNPKRQDMKMTTSLSACACILALGLSLSACIRSEALSSEADIVGVDSLWLAKQIDQGVLKSGVKVENDRIVLNAPTGADLTQLAPHFVLGQGTTIVPANGVARDFTTPQTYTVTAEDGQWRKTYTVAVEVAAPLYHFGFEHSRLRGAYPEFYELQNGTDTLSIWASGNAGYGFTGQAKKPEDFPTTASVEGFRGGCAVLTTRTTGVLGRLVDKPIAAGNLFIGEFQSSSAMVNPLGATRFGLPILTAEPLLFTGYYKYAPSTPVINAKSAVTTLADTADIYAIVYEIDPLNFYPLDGSTVATSDRVVLRARPEALPAVGEWTHFAAPFVLQAGKAFSPERLAAGGYAFAIVASSSKGGAYFTGAVGSRLAIDELQITTR